MAKIKIYLNNCHFIKVMSNFQMKDALAIFLLMAISAFVWTLPFQQNQYPYGDVDSSTHFTLGDYMGQNDKPIYLLPYYINGTIKGVTNGYGILNGGKLWYPPQYHITEAIIQLFSGARVVPIFLFFAFAGSLIAVTTYLLIRYLYGFLPALISGFFLIFSLRDIMWFLAGQHPQVLSFAIAPLVIYSIYRYLESFKEKNPKQIYLYTAILLIAAQFFIHPQAIIVSVLPLAIFSLIFIVKEKIIFINIKHITIAIILLLILTVSFLQFPLGKSSVYSAGLGKAEDARSSYGLGIFFSWYGALQPVGFHNPEYWSSAKIYSILLIPFIIFGAVYLILRRKNQDLLLLSMLLSFYLLMHFSILSFSRAERLIEIEAHIIYPLIVIGAIIAVPNIISLFKISKEIKFMLKYALALLIVLIFIFTIVGNSYNTLKNAYPDIARITQSQYEASEWMRSNLPNNADVYMFRNDFPTALPIFQNNFPTFYTKKKWIQVLSLRHMDWSSQDVTNSTHMILDLSDIYAVYGQQGVIEAQKETDMYMQNATVLYDKNYIKVYKLAQ